MANGNTYTVNYPLTNYAVSWYKTQVQDPAAFLAPSVPVPGLLGTFKRYDRSDAFRVDDTRRGLYQIAKTIDIIGEDVAYRLEDHALQTGIDDNELLGAGDAESYKSILRQSKTSNLLGRMLRSHNKQVFESVNAAITVTSSIGSVTNIGNWSSSSVDAASQLKLLVRKFESDNGVAPNRLLIPKSGKDILSANASIRDMIQYNNVKELTFELLRKIMGYDEQEAQLQIMCTLLPYNASLPGIDGDNRDLLGNSMYLFYAEDAPSLEDITAVKTLNLAGTDEVSQVATFRDDKRQTEWLRVMQHKRTVIAAPSCIYRVAIS